MLPLRYLSPTPGTYDMTLRRRPGSRIYQEPSFVHFYFTPAAMSDNKPRGIPKKYNTFGKGKQNHGKGKQNPQTRWGREATFHVVYTCVSIIRLLVQALYFYFILSFFFVVCTFHSNEEQQPPWRIFFQFHDETTEPWLSHKTRAETLRPLLQRLIDTPEKKIPGTTSAQKTK